jgi:cell division septation protein DedD
VTQTPDTAEDGFHEIQLSGKQLVFLFMATTVVSVLIFLCGVLVGRGVRSGSELDRPADTAAAAQDTAAPAGDAAAPPAADAPPPISETELSYHDRLQQEKPKEQLKQPSPEPAPQQQPPASKPADAPAASAPAATPPPETAKPAARAASDVPTAGRPGTWVIQVHALSNRDAASSIVRQLIAKGYPAFLNVPAANQPAIYRVQIGRYRDRGEADQTAKRLAKEEQLRPEVKR